MEDFHSRKWRNLGPHAGNRLTIRRYPTPLPKPLTRGKGLVVEAVAIAPLWLEFPVLGCKEGNSENSCGLRSRRVAEYVALSVGYGLSRPFSKQGFSKTEQRSAPEFSRWRLNSAAEFRSVATLSWFRRGLLWGWNPHIWDFVSHIWDSVSQMREVGCRFWDGGDNVRDTGSWFRDRSSISWSIAGHIRNRSGGSQASISNPPGLGRVVVRGVQSARR